ncbi:alpha/beta hydrolase, partial [Singulisphaera rosea]
MSRYVWLLLLLSISISASTTFAEAPNDHQLPPAEVRKAFTSLLDRPKVALDVRPGPMSPPSDGLVTERLSFASEKKADGHVERVPVLIIRPDGPTKRRPAVIALHGTGGSKEGLKPWLVELGKLGIVGVAIDSRYHGEREGASKGTEAYNDAITRAWRTPKDQPQEHPFYYDTCWDLWRTIDYLESRDDVDPKRIGMFGISMGGIQTWLAASVDERV